VIEAARAASAEDAGAILTIEQGKILQASLVRLCSSVNARAEIPAPLQ